MYPTAVFGNPISREYDTFLKKVIESLDLNEKGIKIVFVSRVYDSDVLNSLLTRYYLFARKELENAGFDYRFEIDIFFNIPDITEIIDVNKKIFKLQNETFPELKGNIIELSSKLESAQDENLGAFVEKKKNYASQSVVAVGGTFDHIHDGHKILLSMAIFFVKEKLIVGITGGDLLVNKKFAAMLDTFDIRLNSVLNFIKRLLSKDVRFEIYEINDICGPTGYIRDINTLVVSDESIKGAEYVNNYRFAKGFPTLDVVKISVVGDNDSNEVNNWKGKLSSTDIREKEYKRLNC